MSTKKNRLGRGMEDIAQEFERGLGYLLPHQKGEGETVAPGAANGRPLLVDPKLIDLNPDQPRAHFNEQETAELAQSIKSLGVIDPLKVSLKDDGRYELIDGERRLRAVRLLNLGQVPVFIRDLSADQAERLLLALVSNLGRKDLNPLEEAEGFARLEREFGRTHQQIAEMVTRDRSTVTNAVRLLKLPENIKDDIRYKRMTPGHGRALLTLADQGLLNPLREDIIARSISVRQLETLVKRLNKKKKPLATPERDDQAYYEALATGFSRQLRNMKVNLDPRSKKLEIFYTRQEELEWLMQKFEVNNV